MPATDHSPTRSSGVKLAQIDLGGNPNSGKTTLFNALTGMRAKVGNYPGVTVERKEGRLLGAPADRPIVVLDLPGIEVTADAAADVALGAQLRRYSFDRYKTKKDDNGSKGAGRLVLSVADPAAAKKVYKAREGVQQGVIIARDLVNEPPNVLGPQEFAARAQALSKLGVEVEILDDRAMRKLGMNALLGVAQGSVRGGRVAVMRWNGGKASDRPIAARLDRERARSRALGLCPVTTRRGWRLTPRNASSTRPLRPTTTRGSAQGRSRRTRSTRQREDSPSSTGRARAASIRPI